MFNYSVSLKNLPFFTKCFQIHLVGHSGLIRPGVQGITIHCTPFVLFKETNYYFFVIGWKMVRNRTRKTTIGLHSADLMKKGIDLILDGQKIRNVAKSLKIPYTTLYRYYKKATKFPSTQTIRLTPNYASKKVFSDAQEEKLVDYIIKCSQMFYGLTTADVRRLAYEMAKRNDVQVPQKWHETQLAGIDWLYHFRKRHESLSLRTPEGCSLSRATSFNRHNVGVFFDNLEDVMAREPSFGDGTRVFNLDETSTMTVQKSGKVLAARGQKQVSKVTSAEKGTLVTTCYIVNAMGHALPPVMIFPRVHFKQHMIAGAPTGTLGLANPSGWMNSELFVRTMEHFIKHTQSSKENPSLLIMDNYEAHICLDAITLAKENGVTILTVPPHSTGKLQPLDVAIFRPFKIAYNAAVDSWLMRNAGKTFSIYEVAQSIKEAHLKSMTPANICSAFECTGIYPFNKDIFTDLDFAPSEVTNRENLQGDTESESAVATELEIQLSRSPRDNCEITQAHQPHESIECLPTTSAGFVSPSILDLDSTDISDSELTTPLTIQKTATISSQDNILIPQAGQSPSNNNTSIEHQQAVFVSPFEFRGLPKSGPRKNNRKPRRKGKSMIATDTPNKTEIEEREEEKKRKKDRKSGAKAKKRKVLQSESSAEESDRISVYSEEEGEYEEEQDESVLDPDKFPDKLDAMPNEGNFVLVQFDTHNKKVFYIGKVIDEGKGREIVVSYLRRSTKVKNGFRLPDVADIATVDINDVKMILPQPSFTGTKRQQGVYKFELDFSNIDLR